jgi:hypothetical protein
MSPRSVSRTQNCGEADGQVRLDQARAFLEVAELVGTEDDELAKRCAAPDYIRRVPTRVRCDNGDS